MTPEHFLKHSVEHAIRTAIDQAVDDAIEEAKAKLDQAVRKEVGAIAASVVNEYAMERRGNDLIIRVKLIGDHKE